MRLFFLIRKYFSKTYSHLLKDHQRIICFKAYQADWQICIFSKNYSNFCFPEKRKIHLIDKFNLVLSKEDEYQRLRDALSNCDTNKQDWKFKLLEKMMTVYLDLENDFCGLSTDKIQIIQQDYQKMKTKKLLPPKRLNDEIISDLSRIIDNEKSRIHLLAFQGMKQLRKFKSYCDKQINYTYNDVISKANKSKNLDETSSQNSLYYKRNRINYSVHMKMFNTVFEGQNLILDFSFFEDCLNSEHNSIISQTQRLIMHNLDADKPFNVWLTGLSKKSEMKFKMSNFKLFSPLQFINRSEKHFTELFSKEKLIYMSPDAEEEIGNFDHEAIYVLGAIVDRYEDLPLSYNSAKKHGIKSVRLPIDKYIITSGLALDISFLSVFKMLNFMQFKYATWDKAFKQYLQADRKACDLELIEKFNPSLKRFNEKEIEKYKNKMKFQYKNRIFNKMKN